MGAGLLCCAVLGALAPHPEPQVARAGASYGEEYAVRLDSIESRALALCRARLARSGSAASVSGPLVVAARELARLAADGVDSLASSRVRGALARARSFDPAPTAVVAQGPPDSAPDALARSLPGARVTHLGVGAFEKDGTVQLVVLAVDRRVRLSFPRDVAPGALADLSGVLAEGLRQPSVFVTLPSGVVRQDSISGGSTSGAFGSRIELRDAGRYLVEVMAEGEEGPEVVALLTVSAGGAPLDPPGDSTKPAAEPPDDAGAERAVLRAIDATRRRHGLASLEPSSELDAIARRHSAAMAAAGRVVHVLRSSAKVDQRLRRAGIAYRCAYENVARAGSALAAHATAEQSPAHLWNILRADASRVGVGVARVALPSGGRSVYLTEILLETPDDGATSPLTPDARVRENLWRERARLRLPPLTSDVALDALAHDAALAMRSTDQTEAPGLPSRALALRRGIAAVDVFVASAPAEAVRSSNLRDRRFRRVGVGVATGSSRRFGSSRLWIVVVYTD